MTGKEYLESIGITGDIQEVDVGHYKLVLKDSNEFDRVKSIVEKHFDLSNEEFETDWQAITCEYGNDEFNVDLKADFEYNDYVLHIYEVR